MLWYQGISSIFLHQACQDCSEPFPSLGDLPNSGIEPRSPDLHTDFLPSEPLGKPRTAVMTTQTKTNPTFPVASITVLLGYQRRISSRPPGKTNLLPSSSSLHKMVNLFFFFFFFVLFACNLWASLVVQMVKNPPAMQDTWVQALDLEDPIEKGIATHSSIPAWEIPWTEAPGRLHTVHGVAKNRTRLSD